MHCLNVHFFCALPLHTKVPKDWDVLLLGWWGHARSADRVQGSNGAVFHARPPFRKRDGGRQGEVLNVVWHNKGLVLVGS